MAKEEAGRILLLEKTAVLGSIPVAVDQIVVAAMTMVVVVAVAQLDAIFMAPPLQIQALPLHPLHLLPAGRNPRALVLQRPQELQIPRPHLHLQKLLRFPLPHSRALQGAGLRALQIPRLHLQSRLNFSLAGLQALQGAGLRALQIPHLLLLQMEKVILQ